MAVDAACACGGWCDVPGGGKGSVGGGTYSV